MNNKKNQKLFNKNLKGGSNMSLNNAAAAAEGLTNGEIPPVENLAAATEAANGANGLEGAAAAVANGANPASAPPPPSSSSNSKESSIKEKKLWFFLTKDQLASGFKRFASGIIDEPCLTDVVDTEGNKIPRDSIPDNQGYTHYFIDFVAQNFDHLGFLNWRSKGKGNFKSTNYSEKISLKATLKMLFCFIKLTLSPLYLLYIFFQYFIVFLRALNIYNFFMAVSQIFAYVFGFLLSLFVVTTPLGIGLIDYARNVRYENKTDENKLDPQKPTKKMIPIWGVIQFLGGMVFPLQLFYKRWGHTYGYGGVTLISLLVMIISTIIIVYSGLSILIIICVFIHYFYRIFTELNQKKS